MGLVSSINRPGGNATGVSFRVSAREPKRFELCDSLASGVIRGRAGQSGQSKCRKRCEGPEGGSVPIGAAELSFWRPEALLTLTWRCGTLVQKRAGALLVTSDPLFNRQRLRLVELAAHNAIPAMYPWRDFTDAGGLVSYGNSLGDAFRQGGGSIPAVS